MLTYPDQQGSISPPPPARRRQSPSVSEPSSEHENLDEDAGPGGDTQGTDNSHEQMVKKLVRLALASEYSRQPIRRVDIASKGPYIL